MANTPHQERRAGPTRRERDTFVDAIEAAVRAARGATTLVVAHDWKSAAMLRAALPEGTTVATIAETAERIAGRTADTDAEHARVLIEDEAKRAGAQGELNEDSIRSIMSDAALTRHSGAYDSDRVVSGRLESKMADGETHIVFQRKAVVFHYQHQLIKTLKPDHAWLMAEVSEQPPQPDGTHIVWARTSASTEVEHAFIQALDASARTVRAPWVARRETLEEAERGAARALDERRQAVLGALTDEQRLAVDAPAEYNVLVEAGAGTGKTRTLEAKVIKLVEESVAPERIVVITFTNRAARELEGRIGPLMPETGRRPSIGTFHGLAAQILRTRTDQASALLEIEPPLTPDFSILDVPEQGQVLAEAAAEIADEAGWKIEAKERDARLEEWQRFLRINPEPRDMEEQLAMVAHTTEIVSGTGRGKIADVIPTARLAKAYRMRKARRNSVDFSDLISMTVRMLESEPELAPRYEAVLVDEYQDTDETQERMLQQLRHNPGGERHASMFAVGDPDQLIYGWRGANIRNILEMPERIGATRYALTLNWRSTQNILDSANAALEENDRRKAKPLRAATEDAQRPRGLCAGDEWPSAAAEGNAAGQWAIALVREHGTPLGEIAMLARTRDVLTLAENALARAHLPYRLTAGREFGTHVEIRDVAAWLRLIVNPADDGACDRIMRTRKGLGEKSAERARERAQAEGRSLVEALPEMVAGGVLKNAPGRGALEVHEIWRKLCERSARGTSPAGIVSDIIEDTGIGAAARAGRDHQDPDKADAAREQLKRLDDLRVLAGEHATITSFAEHLALADTRCDAADGRSITLSTIHQAKGLEWDHVMVIGVESGVLPHRRCSDSPAQLAEERRCLHVALTRARKSCRISWCTFRHGQPTHRSAFIGEIAHTLHVREHD